MQTRHFFFLAFLFSLTLSWWFAKLEKGGMQIPDFGTSFYPISSQLGERVLFDLRTPFPHYGTNMSKNHLFCLHDG